jgi:hypothetical protein
MTMTLKASETRPIEPYLEGLAEVLDSAVNEMPEPSPIADESIAALSDAEENTLKDQTTFDPSIHEADGSGNPIQNLDGSYRRKRGRKPGQSYDVSRVENSSPETVGSASPKTVAIATVETILTLGRTIGGEEWAPLKDKTLGVDERAQMVQAFEAYYRESGTIEMPAWIGVAIAVGAYALPRTAQPVTQSRLKKIGGWFKRKFGKAGADAA